LLTTEISHGQPRTATIHLQLTISCRFWPPTDQLSGKLLLVLASIVIFGSESRGTHGHILPSNNSRSLQFLSGSTDQLFSPVLVLQPRRGSHRKRQSQELFYFCVFIRCRGKMFTALLPRNGSLFSNHYSGFRCHVTIHKRLKTFKNLVP
jgi:hypothetical protein